MRARPQLLASDRLVHIIVILLIVFPFLTIFSGHAGSEDTPSFVKVSILHYCAIFFSVIMFHRIAGRIHLSIILIVLLFGLTYLVNFMVAPYADPKWLFNSLGFLFVFLSLATIILRLTDTSRVFVEKEIDFAVTIILMCFIVIFVVTTVANIHSIMFYFLRGYHDGSFWLLTSHLGVRQQSMGNLLILLVIWFLCSWNSLPTRRKTLFFVFIVAGFPFWIAIRTFYYAIILLAFVLFFLKTRHLILRYLAISILIVGIIFVVAFWSTGYDHIKQYYSRLPYVRFAFNSLLEHPLGLGNGGYHAFADANQHMLHAEYSREGSTKFARAPESDLAYFWVSFGVLSMVFFGFYIHLVYRCGRILLKYPLSRLEKFLILSCFTIIFAGFGQDNAGGLLWWVYMAAGFATTLKYLDKPLVGQMHTVTHVEMRIKDAPVMR